MKVEGRCHCGNIHYRYQWPGEDGALALRACTCTFCRMHGAAYSARADATLVATIEAPELVSRYQQGTATAEFFVCARCGAVPFVTSLIEGRLYAVVNASTFVAGHALHLSWQDSDFEGETSENRLARRRARWIADVSIDPPLA